MTINYFDNPTTLEELKAQYRKLCMEHHPDLGGDTETMKAVNNEYDQLFEKVKEWHVNAQGERYSKECVETQEQFRDVVDALIRMKMENVNIELCGSFLWLTGNTKPHKDGIKALGFRWSKNKGSWYLSPPGYRRFATKKDYSMNDIRRMYGSAHVSHEERLAIA